MNCLYWITSLREDEQGVSRRVLEGLDAALGQKQLSIRQFIPNSAEEFLSAMDQIAAEAKAGMLPMIHLDTHGSVEGGVLIVATGEYVPWKVVGEKFRVINEVVGNNLCVVSGACFSFRFVKAIDINKASPFFILLAPEQEIIAGDIEDDVTGFYKDMFNDADILSAQEKWFPTQLRVFHCERMLAIVLARYINDAALGQQKEHLVTMAVEQGIPANRHNLRAMRKVAKKAIEPTETLIDHFMPTFLIGKKPGFTIAELKDLVQKARRNGLKPSGQYA